MFAIVQAAGWPIWPLIIASVIALALIIDRTLALRRSKVVPNGLIGEVLQAYRQRQITPDVLSRLENSSPLGRVLSAGLKSESGGRDTIRASIDDAGRAVAHDLSKWLGAIGTIAAVAPLLGLLGTVIGMIEIFGASTAGGTNPQQLAHGISIALYNTAFGLIVAIPALIAFRTLRSKMEALLVDIEAQANRLTDALTASLIRH